MVVAVINSSLTRGDIWPWTYRCLGRCLRHTDAGDTTCLPSDDSVVWYDANESLYYISTVIHCVRHLIMTVWKCDTVCLVTISASGMTREPPWIWSCVGAPLYTSTKRMKFLLLYSNTRGTNYQWQNSCFLISRWWLCWQTPLYIVEEPHIQWEGRYPYEGESQTLFLFTRWFHLPR